jgi:esterase/lipase
MENSEKMVYDHKAKGFKKAINITEKDTEHIAHKLATITAAYADDIVSLSEVTQLIDNSFTRKEMLFLVTMHVKTIYDEATS